MSKEFTLAEIALDNGIDFKNRIIHLDKEIDSHELQDITRGFMLMENESDSPITIVINSPGGSVYDGLFLYDLITQSECCVITKGYGHIMSMATFILCAGDERFIAPNATVMVHEISSWLTGELTDIKIELKEMNRLEKKLIDIYADRTNKPAAYWKKFKKARYFTAEETVEVGLVDEIIGSSK